MFHLTTALDAASGVPLYEQLYESLAAEMRSGAIPVSYTHLTLPTICSV